MFPNVRQYVHRGKESYLEFGIGGDWGTYETSEKARILVLEKFFYAPPYPASGQPTPDYPTCILIHIEGGRGKYLKSGQQTNLLSIIDPIFYGTLPSYSYDPSAQETCEISPTDNYLRIRFVDENDNELTFINPYTITFSISVGSE